MVASVLEISIIRNTNCDNLVGFPKSGHIYGIKVQQYLLAIAT